MADPIPVYTWIVREEQALRRRQTEGPAMNRIIHIGLDVHKDSIAFARSGTVTQAPVQG